MKTGTSMPMAYHGCGVPNLCFKKGIMWSWWMEWRTDHLEDLDEGYLNTLYHHKLIITKDELPDIMILFGE
jgi:hypothetical protein